METREPQCDPIRSQALLSDSQLTGSQPDVHSARPVINSAVLGSKVEQDDSEPVKISRQDAPNIPASPVSFRATASSTDPLPASGQIIPSITTQGWTLPGLLAKGKHFKEIARVLATDPDLPDKLEQYEKSGIPLIVEGWHDHPDWPTELFTPSWLKDNHGSDPLLARNIHNRSDKEIQLSEFIARCRETSSFVSPLETERLYGKDVTCPPQWQDWLQRSNVLPSSLLPNGSNDLLKFLPATEAVESLMCYFGIGDTFTPCHKDLCGSSGHNLMCHTEGGSSFWFMTASENAPDVSEYFQSKLHQELDLETHVVTIDELAQAPFPVYIAEQKLGDLVLVPPRSCHQVVNHGGLTMKISWSRMTIKGLSTALIHELPIYQRVCRPEQYRVKFILYRSVLRYTEMLEAELGSQTLASTTSKAASKREDERSSLFALVDYDSSNEGDGATRMSSQTLSKSQSSSHPHDPQISRHAPSLKILLRLYDLVLCAEFYQDHASLPRTLHDPEHAPWTISINKENHRILLQPPRPFKLGECRDENSETSGPLACDFCGADIFQSFFACRTCSPKPMDVAASPGDDLTICASCYVEGRSCRCGNMEPAQCRPFEILLRDRNRAASVLRRSDASPRVIKKFADLSEKQMISGKRLSIFAAACALHKLRGQAGSKLDGNRACRNTSTSHHVPYLWSIYCNTCHGCLCFQHILDKGVHSAEAFLALVRDPSRTYWHKLHRDSKNDFISRMPSLREAEKKGRHTELRDRLVMFARQYPNCRPLCEAFTRRGWYDSVDAEPIENQDGIDQDVTSTPEEKSTAADEKAMSTRSESPLTEIDSLFSAPSSPPVLPANLFESDKVIAISTTTKNLSASLLDRPSSLPQGTVAPKSATARNTLGIMKTLMPYVLVPLMPVFHQRLKRAASPSSQHARKKQRTSEPSRPKMHVRSSSRAQSQTSEALDSDDDGRAAANYGKQLAEALQAANSEAPRFSNSSVVRGWSCRVGSSPDPNSSLLDTNNKSSADVLSVQKTLQGSHTGRNSHIAPQLLLSSSSKRSKDPLASSTQKSNVGEKFDVKPPASRRREPATTGYRDLSTKTILRGPAGKPPGLRFRKSALRETPMPQIDRRMDIERERSQSNYPKAQFTAPVGGLEQLVAALSGTTSQPKAEHDSLEKQADQREKSLRESEIQRMTLEAQLSSCLQLIGDLEYQFGLQTKVVMAQTKILQEKDAIINYQAEQLREQSKRPGLASSAALSSKAQHGPHHFQPCDLQESKVYDSLRLMGIEPNVGDSPYGTSTLRSLHSTTITTLSETPVQVDIHRNRGNIDLELPRYQDVTVSDHSAYFSSQQPIEEAGAERRMEVDSPQQLNLPRQHDLKFLTRAKVELDNSSTVSHGTHDLNNHPHAEGHRLHLLQYDTRSHDDRFIQGNSGDGLYNALHRSRGTGVD